jgi:hypothetical protein
MSCGCKAKKGEDLSINDKNKPKVNIMVNIIYYSIKVIGFLVAMILLPILMLVIAYYMFNLIVMTKGIDIKPLFSSVAKFMKKVGEDNKDDDDDDDDDDTEWEEIDPDELELIGVDDLTNKENK